MTPYMRFTRNTWKLPFPPPKPVYKVRSYQKLVSSLPMSLWNKLSKSASWYILLLDFY